MGADSWNTGAGSWNNGGRLLEYWGKSSGIIGVDSWNNGGEFEIVRLKAFKGSNVTKVFSCSLFHSSFLQI